jgi:UDP-N-acetylmuramate--alanine ligase
MDLSKIRKIYMIGVKGVGMTMLAQYFCAKGVEVVGSDTDEKFMTDKVLKKAGVKVIEKFDKNNIPKDADLIIYSTSYNAENNVEVAAVINPPNPLYTKGADNKISSTRFTQKGKVRVLTYAEALGGVFNQKYGVAVVGSHGKTTTTAWLGFVMEKAGLSPSVMVGSFVPQFDGLALAGKSDYLVIEADEYQNKLKYFNPKGVLLNNIDYDHPDFFPTEEEYKNVFIEFIKKIPKSGFLIANFDDPIIRKIAGVNCLGKVISYAINESADYVAYNIKAEGGKQYFKVKLGVGDDIDEDDSFGENNLGDFSIGLSGKHNISNALAVIATSIEFRIELVDIRKYLSEFTGTARRMQILGEFKGATIIDDYAHHPTEIKATLEGARQTYKDKKIIVVFHPHTFTRTKALLDDFAKSFGDADEIIVLDIYGSAREKQARLSDATTRQGGVHSRDLVEAIKKQESPSRSRRAEADKKTTKQEIKYISTLKECEEYLRKNIERGDVVILMGAGDVFRIGENLVNYV